MRETLERNNGTADLVNVSMLWVVMMDVMGSVCH